MRSLARRLVTFLKRLTRRRKVSHNTQDRWLTLPNEVWYSVLVKNGEDDEENSRERYRMLHRVERVCKRLQGLFEIQSNETLTVEIQQEKPDKGKDVGLNEEYEDNTSTTCRNSTTASVHDRVLFDTLLVRRKPTSPLEPDQKVVEHPMLLAVDIEEEFTLDFAYLFGNNAFDYKSVDEFATQPAATKVDVNGVLGEDIDGVTVRQVLKATVEAKEYPAPRGFLAMDGFAGQIAARRLSDGSVIPIINRESPFVSKESIVELDLV